MELRHKAKFRQVNLIGLFVYDALVLLPNELDWNAKDIAPAWAYLPDLAPSFSEVVAPRDTIKTFEV